MSQSYKYSIVKISTCRDDKGSKIIKVLRISFKIRRKDFFILLCTSFKNIMRNKIKRNVHFTYWVRGIFPSKYTLSTDNNH